MRVTTVVFLLGLLSACTTQDPGADDAASLRCPSETGAVIEQARAVFAKNRPQANPSAFEAKATVLEDRIVVRFVPTGLRMAGDAPAVIFDCKSQEARFLSAE